LRSNSHQRKWLNYQTVWEITKA